MIKDALIALRDSARTLIRDKGALLVFALLYLLMFVSYYLFITTREATITQLAVTLFTALAVFALFLLIQAASVNYTRPAIVGAKSLLKRAVVDAPKILLATLPWFLLAVGVFYLLGKLQAQIPVEAAAPQVRTYPTGVAAPVRLVWSDVFFTTARLLLLGVMLPLLAIHTWLAVTRRGVGATFKGFPAILRSAFSARSLTIYALGLMLFGVLPYFLIFTRTPVQSPWLELTIFGFRLLLVSALALFGWVLTTGALATSTYDSAPLVAATPSPTVEPEPAPAAA